jgi:hypothetical protein
MSTCLPLVRRVPRIARCLAAAGCLGVPVAAGAQQVETFEMAISGFVDVTVSGSGVQSLTFGMLTPGTPMVVSPLDPVAAKWRFTGIPNNNAAANRYADLTFVSLPSVLGGPGGATLPIGSYQVRVALEKNGVDYYYFPSTYVVSPASPAIDPNPQINGGATPAAPGAGGDNGRSLVVYMGATVNPAAGQRAGVYEGTLTLTFSPSST